MEADVRTFEVPPSPDGSENESLASVSLSEETADIIAAKQVLDTLKYRTGEDFYVTYDDEGREIDVLGESEHCRVLPSRVEFKPARATQPPQQSRNSTDLPTVQPSASVLPKDVQRSSTIGDARHNDVFVQEDVSRESLPSWDLVRSLQSEIKQLQQLSLKATKKIPAEMTVHKIIMGEEYSLEKYRSREEKLELLDEAIRLHDGNAIIAAVLFLQSSTESKLFHQELLLRPAAVEQYISFLKQHHRFDNLLQFLRIVGKKEEAALLSYQMAIAASRTPQEKLTNIQNCYRYNFETDKALAFEASIIHDQISLLPAQLQIQDYDTKNAAQVYRLLPCKASVVGTPLITTLYYCSLYHYLSPENYSSSPTSMSKTYKLNEKQYQWTALRARSQIRNWKDVEKLFETKGWLGGLKMKAVIGFDRVVACLSQMNAPRQELNKYCNLIDNLETRLEVAIKFHCHKCVVDTYVQMKDRIELLNYQSKLMRGTGDWVYANDILNTSTIKWKN